jgi:hypothetical protein
MNLPDIACPLVINERPTRGFLKSLGISPLLLKHVRQIWIRSRLSEAQNHRCAHCSTLTTEVRGKSNSSTIDHYICRHAGGTDEWENYIMACHYCNKKRGPLKVEEFHELLKISDPQKRSAAIRIAHKRVYVEMERARIISLT